MEDTNILFQVDGRQCSHMLRCGGYVYVCCVSLTWICTAKNSELMGDIKYNFKIYVICNCKACNSDFSIYIYTYISNGD